MKNISVITLFILFHLDTRSQTADLSKDSYQLNISPFNLFDASAGGNVSLQVGKRFDNKWNFLLEYGQYIGLPIDRFYYLRGNKFGFEIRKYYGVFIDPFPFKNEIRHLAERSYISMSILYKHQAYGTYAYIEDEWTNEGFYQDLDFNKAVFIFDIEIGTEIPMSGIFTPEMAIGISIRHRDMKIANLDQGRYTVGTITDEDYGTYRWADHENSGWFISPAVSFRMSFDMTYFNKKRLKK